MYFKARAQMTQALKDETKKLFHQEDHFVRKNATHMPLSLLIIKLFQKIG